MTESEVVASLGKPLWKKASAEDPRIVTWGYYSDNMVRVDRLQIVFRDGLVFQAPSGMARSHAASAEQSRVNAETLQDKLDAARRKEFIDANPDTPDAIREAIMKGAVRVGMTEDQAIAAWGPPEKRNRTTTAHGSTEQWVYPNEYLYLENKKVTATQTSR